MNTKETNIVALLKAQEEAIKTAALEMEQSDNLWEELEDWHCF